MIDLLLPRARIRVLSLLLLDPTNMLYLREIARMCRLPVRAVQREVALYEKMELCDRVPRGKQVFYRVRTDHPLFQELRSLLVKASATSPIPEPLPQAPLAQAAGARRPDDASQVRRRADSWRVW